MDTVMVKPDELRRMTVKRLVEAGMSQPDAETVADVLVYAELRGVASHGVVRVEHYCNRIRAGGINLNPGFKVDFLKPGMGRLDAKGGMGHLAGVCATKAAIAAARTQGMAMVGIVNSSHCGALAYYTQMALDARMASLVCVHTDKLVAPFGGRFAFLGSNPLAFGYPGRKDDILFDMATSQIPWGKVINHRVQKKPLEPGLVQDAQGNPTTDADKAVSLTPFGGHKGYGVSLMIECLTGLLLGGVFGPHLAPMYQNIDKYRNLSNFILVIDPAVFWNGNDAFLDVTQNMIDEIHAQSPAAGFERVMLPGEIERAAMLKNKEKGISVPKAIYDFLAK